MITSISWKNIWRNKSRSFIILTAITLGTVAGVFVAGLMNGWVIQRTADVINLETGHLKIQNTDYLINEESKYSVLEYGDISTFLDTSKSVSAWSSRSKVVAMASSARSSSGITLKGIDPDKDKQVSDLHKKILPRMGGYFKESSRRPQVLISRKTAEQLKIWNYRVTESVVDSLLELGVPNSSIAKLDSIVGKRYITKKRFENVVKNLWTVREVKDYSSDLIDISAYVRVGSKLAFRFTNVDGEIDESSFQICGVFKTSNSLFDQSSAFVRHSDLVAATGMEEGAFHEISVMLQEPSGIDDMVNFLNVKFSDNTSMSWKKLQPDVGMMADFMGVYYYIIMGVIFLALAFGIINTMLMAILERVKELGMLMAIGMKKFKVFLMIMTETILLTLTGSIVGMLIGGVLIWITGRTGIVFSGVEEGFESMGWSSQVYPSIELHFFFGIVVLVIVVSILSAIVPAQKALKLRPIEALRIE